MMGARFIFLALWVLAGLTIGMIPAKEAQARANKQAPRTDKPMGEDTAYFMKDQFKVKGQTYIYYSYAPMRGAQAGPKGYPLVLVLHGAPGNGYAARFLSKPPLAQKYPAFIIVPVLPARQHWAWPDGKRDGLAASVAIIKNFAENFPVDPDRIYVIGCSEGGNGAFGAARYFPDFFAAAVTISGGWDPKQAPEMTQLPILALHGAKDEIIPMDWAAATIDEIRKYGGKAQMHIFEDMNHYCPSSRFYSDAVWQWLFAQRRNHP